MYVCNTPPDHSKTHSLSIQLHGLGDLKNPNLLSSGHLQDPGPGEGYPVGDQDRLDSRPDVEDSNATSPAGGFEGNSSNGARTASASALGSHLRREERARRWMGAADLRQACRPITWTTCVDLGNVHEFERQIAGFRKRPVPPRPRGSLLIIGTRWPRRPLQPRSRRRAVPLAGQLPVHRT